MNGSIYTKFSSLLGGALLATTLVTGFTTAQAASVFAPIFEMDGNPQAETAPGDDWQDLYGSGSGNSLSHIVTIPDQIGLPGFVGPDNIFHHGCSDVKDIFGCYVKVGDKTLPDKNDWTNGSIALYNLSLGSPVLIPGAVDKDGNQIYHQDGDLIVVMQGDIHAPNGDASLGSWFFQEDIIQAPAPGEHFPIHRTPGDLFIEADFTGGGDNVAFSVYTWTGVKNNTVQLLFTGEGLKCNTTDSPLGCAVSNDQTVGTVPIVWPYTAKGDDPGTSTHYPETTFFEGIFNFSAAMRALNTEMGCFSSFLYETRSSHSLTARLHDYILGGLPMCGMAVEKTGPDQSKPTDDVDYTITVRNTGVVALDKTSIDDTLLGDLSGDTGCGATLNAGQSCTINVSRTILGSDADPLPNTVTAVYSFGSDTIQASASHSIDLFVPGVSITKNGPAMSKVGDDVTYSFVITNETDGDPATPAKDGSAPDLLLTSINDTLIGDISSNATAAGCNRLAVGGSCSFDITRTVLAGDSDPTNNTVTIHYSPEGFPNDLDDNASHSVDLFAPAVQIVKNGETISKAGDDVTYHFTITNKTDGDLSTPALDGTAPALVLDSVFDSLVGDLTTQANAEGCGTLAMGASCNFSFTRTVLGSDLDPLNNTVIVHYHPTGFDNDVADNDNHSVDLFAPAVQIVKSGDTTSKAGDDVTYTFTITNKSDGNLNTTALDGTAPALVLATISDSLLGDLAAMASNAGCSSLAMGGSCSFSVPRTVLGTDADPLNNTVDVLYHPADFPNDVADSDSHSVDLFRPGVQIVKSGDATSKAGDDVTYSFIITNKSDGDLATPALDGTAPPLVLDTISDTVLGDLAPAAIGAGCGSLAMGGSCNFSVTRAVLGTDADPLNNTVNVLYHPAGFRNDVADNDNHSVDLFRPEVLIEKTGDATSKIGDDVTYTFTITNKSDGDLTTPALDGVAPDLVLANISDSVLGDLAAQAGTAGCTTLNMGGNTSCSFQVGRTVLESDPDQLSNTVNVLYHPANFPNDITASASHLVDLFQPEISLSKVCKDPSDGDNIVVVGHDAVFEFTLGNSSSADTPALQLLSANDTLLGNITGSFPSPLTLGQSTVSISHATEAPGMLNNTIEVTYKVAGFPNLLTRTASAACEVVPGDEGCTPGYWKTHPEQWDGVAPDATTTVQHQDGFNVTFGVNPSQSGLKNTVTLMDAVNLGGGGLIALNRHAAAALPSAEAVEYSYSLAGVIALYRDAINVDPGPESIYSALAKLSTANEKGCPLN